MYYRNVSLDSEVRVTEVCGVWSASDVLRSVTWTGSNALRKCPQWRSSTTPATLHRLRHLAVLGVIRH